MIVIVYISINVTSSKKLHKIKNNLKIVGIKKAAPIGNGSKRE